MVGVYFSSHETKDYFPEGVELVNLSMNTLKGWKNHDPQLFTCGHAIIEKIIIQNNCCAVINIFVYHILLNDFWLKPNETKELVNPLYFPKF